MNSNKPAKKKKFSISRHLRKKSKDKDEKNGKKGGRHKRAKSAAITSPIIDTQKPSLPYQYTQSRLSIPKKSYTEPPRQQQNPRISVSLGADRSSKIDEYEYLENGYLEKMSLLELLEEREDVIKRMAEFSNAQAFEHCIRLRQYKAKIKNRIDELEVKSKLIDLEKQLQFLQLEMDECARQLDFEKCAELKRKKEKIKRKMSTIATPRAQNKKKPLVQTPKNHIPESKRQQERASELDPFSDDFPSKSTSEPDRWGRRRPPPPSRAQTMNASLSSPSFPSSVSLNTASSFVNSSSKISSSQPSRKNGMRPARTLPPQRQKTHRRNISSPMVPQSHYLNDYKPLPRRLPPPRPERVHISPPKSLPSKPEPNSVNLSTPTNLPPSDPQPPSKSTNGDVPVNVTASQTRPKLPPKPSPRPEKPHKPLHHRSKTMDSQLMNELRHIYERSPEQIQGLVVSCSPLTRQHRQLKINVDADDDETEEKSDDDTEESKLAVKIDLYDGAGETKAKRDSSATREKRRCVLQEIIDTEETYIKHLNEVVEWFLEPLRRSRLKGTPIVSEEQEIAIFSNIEAIHRFHKDFLDELKKADDISQVFISQGSFFKLTAEYAKNYEKAQETLKSLEKNKKLQEIIKDDLRKKYLSEKLILPIQRIPRYVLLLKELKRHTPQSHQQYQNVTRALEVCEKSASNINEFKRAFEQSKKLWDKERYTQSIRGRMYNKLFGNRETMREIDEAHQFIRQPDFKITREGIVWRKFTKSTEPVERELFLGTGILLWGTASWTEGIFRIDDECLVKYVESNIASMSADLHHGFKLSSSKKEETFFCNSKAVAESWIEDIETAIFCRNYGIESDNTVVDFMDILKTPTNKHSSY